MKRHWINSFALVCAVFLSVIGLRCGDSPYWFGSAGPSGIDIVSPLPRSIMMTSDSNLIPVLAAPAHGAADITLHQYDKDSNKAVLTWKPVPGASGYRVVLSTTNPFGSILVDDSTLTSTDTFKAITFPLSYQTDYFWAVGATGADGKQGWSSIRQFTTKIHPLPKRQRAYVAQKFGMFIHFGISTFSRHAFPTPHGEWATGKEDPNIFNPSKLDLGQWADVAKSAGCTYAVMTAKHHGGFCLWPSKGPWSLKPHSIELSSWYKQNGNRDILQEFVEAMRDRGIEPGFYYSIRDEANPPTLPMILGHVRELMTNYGDIKVIWFDGWGWHVGYYKIPFKPVADLVQKLNDSLGHHTILSENNHQKSFFNTEIIQYEIPIDGPPLAGNTLASEGCEPLRGDNCWFWHPMNTTLKSTKFILDRIVSTNAVNATYLLDVTPDTTGKIPDDQVAQMDSIGTAAVEQGILP